MQMECVNERADIAVCTRTLEQVARHSAKKNEIKDEIEWHLVPRGCDKIQNKLETRRETDDH